MIWALAGALALGVPDESCEDCHDKEAAAHAKSRHAQCFDNPTFQVSFHDAQLKSWCTGCHKPAGIQCQDCHVVNDVVHGPTEMNYADHKVVGDAAFEDGSLCARCHQFAGPSNSHPVQFVGDALQNTVSEWREVAGAKCGSCHDDHRALGARDKSLVRSALTVVAKPNGAGADVRVATTDKLAHRIPTGDPFRRMQLRLCSDPVCKTVVSKYTMVVIHQYEGHEMKVVSDSRLGPPGGSAPSEITLTSAARPIWWQLEYLLAEPSVIDDLQGEEGRWMVAEGHIP